MFCRPFGGSNGTELRLKFSAVYFNRITGNNTQGAVNRYFEDLSYIAPLAVFSVINQGF